MLVKGVLGAQHLVFCIILNSVIVFVLLNWTVLFYILQGCRLSKWSLILVSVVNNVSIGFIHFFIIIIKGIKL